MASRKAGQDPQPRRKSALAEIRSALGEHPAEDVFLGIDLGTEESTTALAAIHWPVNETGRLIHIWPKVWHGNLVDVLNDRHHAVAAIDVPLGWPEGFRGMVEAHASGPLTTDGLEASKVEHPPVAPGEPGGREWRTELMALRETDRYVWHEIGQKPLSVAFDKFGAATASWALIEAFLDWTPDRTGAPTENGLGRIIETYPAAQVRVWANRHDPPLDQRLAVTTAADAFDLDLRLEDADVRRKFDATATHGRDAVVCAIVAALAGRESVHVSQMLPTGVAQSVACAEGAMWLDREAHDG